MKTITEIHEKKKRKETILQFGEGGFLRAFVEPMVQKLNDSNLWEGSVVVAQPIPQGMCSTLNSQDCLYTLVARGLEKGKPVVRQQIIDVISRCVNPYEDFDAYLKLAQNSDLSILISNTTEAGISYHSGDLPTDRPPHSFPAKLTVFLYERYRNGLGGFLILPCELIEKNGTTLKELVLRYSKEWGLENGFIQWLLEENFFFNTLVDRIVTGYDGEFSLPYRDDMLDTCELYHLWVIEGASSMAARFPLQEAGLNVVWTDDVERYRTRKVRILNGAHTCLAPYALLRGFETVKECMDDPEMLAFLQRCVFDEILPTLDLDASQLKEYAQDVFERFSNPYLKHRLSSIALCSISKFRVRVLPSILEYIRRKKEPPATLLMAFAALLHFCRTDMAHGEPQEEAYIRQASTKEILENKDLWGQDLSFLYREVMRHENSLL